MAKENAAARVERIKKEKNGLDVLKDIHRYSILGENIDKEDIDRFKWYGLYTQNTNLQDENDTTLYFMLRVKLENASMNLEQLRVCSQIAEKFARGTADFTTRQDIQFHFIRVTDLPEIFRLLNTVGLSSVFAAGDVPRNVATCPVSGLEHNEIYDASSIVSSVNDYLRGNKDLSNLPRKYKISISSCSKHCVGHEIQDLSFSAVKVENDVLFEVYVGGGLASNKRFADYVGTVEPSKVLNVVKTVSMIYRDYGLRENRRKARLGHLIKEWGVEKFKEVLIETLGFKLQELPTQIYTPYAKREHFGVHNSKIKGKSYIGYAINGGKINDIGLKNLANTLEAHGASAIRTTSTQNFVVSDVPNENIDALCEDLEKQGIDSNPSSFKARTISCTGINFCKFAITETKSQAMRLTKFLEKKFPDFNETVSISLNGCPNSCAHPHIVDIGLLGTKVRTHEGLVQGFELIIAGNLEGENSSFGEKVGIKVPLSRVEELVENIIIQYISSNATSVREFLKKEIYNEKFISSLLK